MELVTLLADDGTAIGTARKDVVHTTDTPLHLAFSCYVLDELGRILVTRRALSKVTWPGVWTNSVCGHPQPEESLADAVYRRGHHELGAQLSNIRLVIPDFRYRAVDASGIVENEICPVYTATVRGEFVPNPTEVVEWSWAMPTDLVRATELTPFAFSPWLREQLPLLISALPVLR